MKLPDRLKNSGSSDSLDQILLVQVSMFLSVETVYCPLLSGNTRRATRNFWGHGRFRGIWALRQKHKKRRTRRKKFWNFFLLDTLKTTF